MADLLDVLTLPEAMAALPGLRSGPDDARVAGLVTAVSRRLDRECGPIVRRSVVEVHRDVGAGSIFLHAKPADGTIAVSEAYSSETPVVTATTAYVVDGREVSRWFSSWAPRVTVSFVAGRFATTALVEEPFKSAAAMLLQHWWRPSNGGGTETYGLNPGLLATGVPSFGFPNTVRDMLAGELLAPAVA